MPDIYIRLRMKIVIAVHHFKEGGAQRVASILINNLSLKHEVYVAVLLNEINYPLAFNRFKYIKLSDYNGFRLFRIPLRLFNFSRILKRISPDVIISFGNNFSIYTNFAIKLSRIKNFKFIASERTDPSKEPSNCLLRKMRDLSYSNANLLVCQTEQVVDYFKNKINTNFIVIPNPISPNLPSWKGNKSNVIITACRIDKQKNLPMLISVFSKVHIVHPEIFLEIYGDGPLKKQIEELIRSLHLQEHIKLKGFSKNIHSIMASSLAYVSSSNYEGISNSMLEALGIGLPTICTDCPVGGAAMFIKNYRNGILIPVGDENALYKAMIKIIKDESFRITISKESQKIKDLISESKITEQWELVL